MFRLTPTIRAVERMEHPSVRAETIAARLAAGRTFAMTDIMHERARKVNSRRKSYCAAQYDATPGCGVYCGPWYNASMSDQATRTSMLQLRLTEAEKDGFLEAATLAGLPLSAWARERLRTQAIRELGGAGRRPPFAPSFPLRGRVDD